MSIRGGSGAASVPPRPTPREEPFIRPQPYICELHGHIMDKWFTKTGLPKPTQFRKCVIPGCKFTQERKAPQA